MHLGIVWKSKNWARTKLNQNRVFNCQSFDCFTGIDTSVGELQHGDKFQLTVRLSLNCSSVVQKMNKSPFLAPNCILK